MSCISDPIADMLTRMRNGLMAKHVSISLPHSKMKKAIAQVLKSEGYISDVKEIGEGVNKELSIELKYYNEEPVIEKLKRVSKPSCRVYVGVENMPRVLNGLGISILSTSKGILSNRKALKQNVGGEVLCYVW